MTILITLEDGITMKVEDVEEYIISTDGLLVKKRGFEPHLFKTCTLVERIK